MSGDTLSEVQGPVWRSMLFVPATNDKLIAKAHTRGADAIILDLEDSVVPEQKSQARDSLPTTTEALAAKSCDVLVRVNAESLEADIAAASRNSVSAIVIPKVNDANAIVEAAALLDRYEKEQGINSQRIGLIAQIEDVQALPRLDAIAQSSQRLLGMSLGSEDFSASVGMLPTPETLYGPSQQVVFACSRAKISAFGFPASITLIHETDALSAAARQAAEMGMVGAFCIHPNQVSVLNRALTPAEEDVSDAIILLQKFDQAQQDGRGVISHNGKMVDLPVVLRARALVARADEISKKLD